MTKKLEITLNKSVIGQTKGQSETVKALGLKKLNDTVVKQDNAAMRGMIEKVAHLITVKEQ